MIDGLTCAACSWLITRSLRATGRRRAGRASIPPRDARASCGMKRRIKLSRLMRVIAESRVPAANRDGRSNADALVQASGAAC